MSAGLPADPHMVADPPGRGAEQFGSVVHDDPDVPGCPGRRIDQPQTRAQAVQLTQDRRNTRVRPEIDQARLRTGAPGHQTTIRDRDGVAHGGVVGHER